MSSCVSIPSISREVMSQIRNGEYTEIPMKSQDWEIRYNGHGFVRNALDGSLEFSPKKVLQKNETSSALVTLKLVKPIKDFAVKMRFTTVRQLREDQPNDWEVFWFLANYQDSIKHQKLANYVVFKPQTGIELGKIFNEVGQEFLKTEAHFKFALNSVHEVTVIKKGQRLWLMKDEKTIFEFSGDSHKTLYDHFGTFGLYTEDALVTVHSFKYLSLD